MGRRSFLWLTATSCCGTSRQAQARLWWVRTKVSMGALELDFLGWIQNTLPPPHIWNFEINYCIGMMQGRRCRELSARPCGSKRKALWNGTEPHWGWLQVQVCSFHKAFLKPHLRRDTYAGLIPHCWLASPAFTWVLKMNLSTFLGVSLFSDTHFEYFAFCRAKYCVYFSCLIP